MRERYADAVALVVAFIDPHEKAFVCQVRAIYVKMNNIK